LVLGGHRLAVRHNNQPIIGGSDRRDDEEDARPGWSVWGGVFLILGWRIEQQQKITKIKYNKCLRWLPFDILSHNNHTKIRGRDGGGTEWAAQPCKDVRGA
jgi:hypothetical protein